MDARQILALSEPSDLKSAAPPSSTKLASFNAPQPLRKTKRQRDIDAQLEKQRIEEENAAKAYAEFVQAFDVDAEDDIPLNATPRANATRPKGKGFVRAELEGKTVYNPTFAPSAPPSIPPPSQPAYNTVPTGPRSSSHIPTGPRPNQSRPLPPPPEPVVEVTGSAPKPFGRKKRDMDNFLEQLKREQKEREDRLGPRAGQGGASVTALAAREYAPTLTGAGYGSGSYAVPGDPLTTNLHVSPLPANITEETLGLFFAQHGPVGSVKIMWPRADGPIAGGPPVRRAAGNNLGGFVAFLRRPDAVKAAKEFDGLEWGGNVLRIGWGKSVPLPSDAIYEIEGAGSSNRRRRSYSPSQSSSPRASSSRQHGDQPSSSKRRRSSSRSRSPPRRIWPKLETEEEENFLSTVARKLQEHGNEFEHVLREREKSNPKFEFFWNDKIPSYHYFRMLLDRRYQAPTPDQIFQDEGSDSAYSTDSAEESETESLPKGKLGKLSRRRFASLLRGLSGRRVDVARGMKFALDRGDAGDAISSLLISSLLILSTSLPQKLARLHLLSDILHNSALSLPHAWTYRSLFSSKLTPVFDHLSLVHRAIDGRLNAEKFRLKIISLVEIWEGWCVFELGVTDDFRRRLNGEEEVKLGGELEIGSVQAATAVYRPPWIPSTATSTVVTPAPAPTKDPIDRPSKFSKSGFKSTSFQPAPLDDFLPDVAPVDVQEEDVDGEDFVQEEESVDVDGEEMDGDAIEVAPAPVVPIRPAPLVEEEKDDEPMVLDDSDDDIFA